MNYFSFITQDWKINKNNSKGRIVLVLFRMANFCSKKRGYFYLGLPYLIFYKFFVEWVLAIEIPFRTTIGKNFSLFHGQALVIHENTVFGENCVVRQSTTIGNKQLKNGYSSSPVIGNFVDIGSNVCIIGDIVIKDNVMIGCGTVVTKSVSGNCIVVGNPGVEKKRAVDKVMQTAI
ncbi:MAG: hypothetical protein ABI151_10085 [Chitinophagaceae bacterium]